jgi:bifunctional DNA-binding transcriptional regulator/antitoxin component of YhaV-PrlF toxin-antitoxin module
MTMKTVFQVRLQRGGRITLPKELRDRARFEPGTKLTLHDPGNGVLLLSRAPSRVSGIADNLAQQWREAGVSLEDMLDELRRVRKEWDVRDP